MAELLFEKCNTPLRQQEQIFALSRVAINSFKDKSINGLSCLFFILIYLKVTKNDLFKKIEQNELTLQKLSDSFGELILNRMSVESEGIPITDQTNGICLVYVEAQLLIFYDNTRHPYKRTLRSSNTSAPIKSKLENEIFKLSDQLKKVKDKYPDFHLRVLMDKINLLEQIQLKE